MLGYYGVYVIFVIICNYIKVGIDFVCCNNICLVICNIGYDFIGCSIGVGFLIINIYSFQDVNWILLYVGFGLYFGFVVIIVVGVQGCFILEQGYVQVFFKVIVIGECLIVGVVGGFIQGGGYGLWIMFKGFFVDNVFVFEVIIVFGYFVIVNEV